MANIQPGDVVVDPMCGGGSIGIEVCKVVFACVYLYMFIIIVCIKLMTCVRE